jgi:ribosome-binding protein aMBF1 (putative translation factor)
MGSSVIVGSSWGKVLKHCNSWGQNVITPKKQNKKKKNKKQKTKNKKKQKQKQNKTYTIHALKHDYILS